MNDAGFTPPRPRAGWPTGVDGIALVLQGGGALGAYQAGVYQALHEAGLEPSWAAGVSIGSINAALIAGNPPERRLERLREFWDTITARPVWPFPPPDGDDPQKALHVWSAFLTLTLGQPDFFTPNVPNPWFSLRGAKTATSFYDSAPLRTTLERLIDFKMLNDDITRYAAGAVSVATGNFHYFDSARTEIGLDHVMASAALPPALPMVQVGTDWFWDGGLVSNTPLQHLLDNATSSNMLVFQVDLFSARGPLPRDMWDVLARQKDIQYSSRTRLVTDYFTQRNRQQALIKSLLDRLPDAQLSKEERELKQSLTDLPEITILHLIYQQAAYEGQAKDYDFSAISMRRHWDNGYSDTRNTLRHKEWLKTSPDTGGVTVHDVHRADLEN
jgi:NTE family protein